MAVFNWFDYKSNLENVGIFCEREEGRSKHGQHLFINRPKLATPVTQTAENQGFNGVSGVAKNPLLTESGGWYAVSDEEIPPEFLKPTPPLQEKQAGQVQLSL